MPVRIALAGRVGIESNGQLVPTDKVRMAGWVAFAYLIAERHRPVRQDELADVIWGDELPRSWATMVRGVVSALRTALSAAGLESDAISTAFSCYQLQLPDDAVVDVEDAAADVALAEAALAAGKASEARQRAIRASSVAAGQFLPGASGTWVERRQRDLSEIRVRALEALAQAAASGGAHAEAVTAAEEAVKLEPLRESTHLRLISAHAAAGNRAEALRAYESCRRLLAEELGVRPSTAIEAEYLRLLAEEEEVPAPSLAPRVDVRSLPSALARAGQGLFIGRSAELDQLTAEWEAAARGARLGVMVGGEPGIGKTRLVAQFARAVHGSGGRVLYGRCDEELEVPYQPVADIVRLALAEASAGELADHVKAWGGELARLVPDVLSRLPAAPAASTGDPQTERWRLFDAVDAFLSDLSAGAPLLVVVDDLHWAGSPTLAILRHLLRSTRPASMLVLGSYRHTEVNASHTLASLLADLRRDGTVTRLTLGGLAADDVALLFGAATGTAVDHRADSFVKSLHETTRGNPFFIGELLRHLAAAGAFGTEGPPNPERLETGIPEGVREVVTRRLLRLAATSNRVLAAAAVCGADFDAALLEELEEPDAVLDSLDEAVAAHLVTESGVPGRYSFCHALVRHTIYDQLGPARRARLHRRVGEALEHRHGTRGPHVGALARHFSAGAPAGVAAKAADYALVAAQVALDQLAFEEAVSLLRTGLAALEAGQPDLQRQGQLLITLGGIYVRYDDFPAVEDTGRQLLDLAERSNSAEHFGHGVHFRGIGGGPVYEPGFVRLAEEALERLGEHHPNLRAFLLIQLARARQQAGESGEAAGREAVALARKTPDPPGLLRAALYGFVNFLRWRGDPADLPEWLALADEIVAIEDHLPAAVGNGVRVRAAARLRVGDRDGYEADVAEMARRREKSPSVQARAMVLRQRVLLAVLDGRLAGAEMFATELHQLGGPALIDPDVELAHMLFLVRREQGRMEAYLPELEGRIAARPPFLLNYAVLGLARAEVGDDEGSRREAQVLAGRLDQLPPSWDRAGSLSLVAELLSLAGDPAGCAVLYDTLLPHSGQFVTAVAPAFYPMAADRALGLLAARTGDLDAAERHFKAAIVLEEGLRAFALAARTRYSYARALLAGRRNRRRPAEALLLDSLNTADELGLAGLARAVRRLQEPQVAHQQA